MNDISFISFGAVDEASLVDFITSPGDQAAHGPAQPASRPTPQNTARWRCDFSPRSSSSAQKSAILSLGEELLAFLPTSPPAQEEEPVAPPPDAAPAGQQAGSGLFAQANGTLLENLNKFEQVIQTYRERLGQNALIETSVAGSTVARTYIGFSGDFRTIVLSPADPAVFERHLETLRLVQAQRLAAFNLIVTIDHAFQKMEQALSVSQGLGSLGILSATWNFIKTVTDVIHKSTQPE